LNEIKRIIEKAKEEITIKNLKEKEEENKKLL
jgi:hypothetical protein